MISTRICANGNSLNRTSLTGHADQVALLPVAQDHRLAMEEGVKFSFDTQFRIPINDTQFTISILGYAVNETQFMIPHLGIRSKRYPVYDTYFRIRG